MEFLRSVRNKDNSRSVSVYRDDHGEFTLIFFIGGILQCDADYFTDDEADTYITALHFVDSAPSVPVNPDGFKPMSNAEFAATVGPLIQRGIAFELALPDYWMARLTWNVGDKAVKAVFQNGVEMNVAMPDVNGKVPA